MKKKAKAKTKSKVAKKTAVAAAEPEVPEILIVMRSVGERLEALEKKMEQVLYQTSHRPQQQIHIPQSPRPEQQHYQPPRHEGAPSQPVHHQPHPVSQVPQPNQPQQQSHAGRPMFKAVCADCSKDCEVPFKPAEGRSIYCKECFAKRKNSGRPQQQTPQSRPGQMPPRPVQPVPPPPPSRNVQVIKKGVGKVTITHAGHGHSRPPHAAARGKHSSRPVHKKQRSGNR